MRRKENSLFKTCIVFILESRLVDWIVNSKKMRMWWLGHGKNACDHHGSSSQRRHEMEEGKEEMVDGHKREPSPSSTTSSWRPSGGDRYWREVVLVLVILLILLGQFFSGNRVVQQLDHVTQHWILELVNASFLGGNRSVGSGRCKGYHLQSFVLNSVKRVERCQIPLCFALLNVSLGFLEG